MLTFDHIYRTYFQDIYRFTLWLSRDPNLADDLTSETFVRAWARRERLRTETLKAYLLATARNLFLKHRHRVANHDELSWDLPDVAPDPLQQTSYRLEFDRVARILATLAEPDRTALILRSENRLSYAEIARVLEISEGAARVRVHRTRRRLLADKISPVGGNS